MVIQVNLHIHRDLLNTPI